MAACASSGPDGPEVPGGSDTAATETPSSSDGAGGSIRQAPFPKPEALDDLRQQPRPQTLRPQQAAWVDEWELTGPFPSAVAHAPHPDAGLWGDFVANAAAQRAGLALATESMHCVAREVGLFTLEHDNLPSSGVARFIAGRCNELATGIQFDFLASDQLSAASEPEIFEGWRARLDFLTTSRLTGRGRVIGIWFGRRGERAIAVVASGLRQVHLEPLETIVREGSELVIRGEILEPTEEALAYVGRGRYGVRKCTFADTVALPRFEIVCPIDRGDELAWVDVTSRKPGRIVGAMVAELLFWPGGRAGSLYRAASYGREIHAIDTTSARAGLLELLNDARAAAGVPPVVDAPAQSRVAEELAPHFFGALTQPGAETIIDVVILGLMAGWQVDGIVQSGHFTGAQLTRSNDLNLMLSEALDRPAGRAALLADDVDRVAIGPVVEIVDGEPVMAAIFGTYALLSTEAHEADAQQVYELLEAHRAERGRSKPRLLDTVTPLATSAAALVKSGQDPRNVLGELIAASVDTLQRSVQGWMTESSEIEDIRFPDDYLNRRDLEVAIAVSHRKTEDSPWGHYVVLVIAAEPEGRGA
jgi:hypothetical protein